MNRSYNPVPLRDQIYDRLSSIALSLASPARLRMIQLLSQSPHTVEELSRISGLSIANTSQHLQKLAKEGVVFARKDGNRRVYSVSGPEVLNAWEALQELGSNLRPELRQAENELTDFSLRTPLPTKQVLGLSDGKSAVLVDVREEQESSASPVPGALRIPLKTLLDGLKNEKSGLRKSSTIFVFCRGRFCPLASEAVRALRSRGFEAFRLSDSPFKITQLQEAV